MTIARVLPLHIHGALEVALAPILMAAPFVLGFDVAAGVASVVIGALLLAVALATHADEQAGLPISLHAALDVAFAAALSAAAVTFAVAGDPVAGVFLGATALAVVLMISLTRYSAAHA
jgi:hypothetical protein